MLAFFSSILMLAVYVYTQLLGIIENLDVWIATITWLNGILLLIFITLFGVTFSYQVFLWRQPKTCSLNKKFSGAGASGIGTFGLFFVSQCPACASLGTLLLPISVAGFLSEFSWLLNLLSIGLLLFTLNYLGAFKKEGQKNE
ncbi:MAG: hypothetical protein AABW85_00060 [archaeon]